MSSDVPSSQTAALCTTRNTVVTLSTAPFDHSASKSQTTQEGISPSVWPEGRTGNEHNATMHKKVLSLLNDYVRPSIRTGIQSLGEYPSMADAETKEEAEKISRTVRIWNEQLDRLQNSVELQADFLDIFTRKSGEPSQFDSEESLIAGILWAIDAKVIAGYSTSRVPIWKVPGSIGPPRPSRVASNL